MARLSYTHKRYPNLDSKPKNRETAFDIDDMFTWAESLDNAPTGNDIGAWMDANDGIVGITSTCKGREGHGNRSGLLESDEFYAAADARGTERAKGLKKDHRKATNDGRGRNGGLTKALFESVGETVTLAMYCKASETDAKGITNEELKKSASEYEITSEWVIQAMMESNPTLPPKRKVSAEEQLKNAMMQLKDQGVTMEIIATAFGKSVDEVNELIG